MVEGFNPPTSPSQPEKKSKRNLWIGIVVIVVVVAVVASVVAVSMTGQKPYNQPAQINPHFGFITLNMAKQITGTNLTQSATASTTVKASKVIKAEETFYNSTSGGSILIVIAQFSNSTTATSFFNSEMSILNSAHTTITNATYDTFSYSYASVSFSSYFEGLAIGHSGDFVFLITDINIPVSNFNTVIQNQINAMM